MSDLGLNLIVVTDHLNELATRQQTVADKLTGSNRLTSEMASRIRDSHGLICSATALAMMKGDEARKAAGKKMESVSSEFNAKLETAAKNYNNVDYREGRSLGEACNS